MTSDPTRRMLGWLRAIDPPSRAILACDHAALSWVPPGAVGIRLPCCQLEVGLSLPAQVLASGVTDLEVVECPQHPEESRRHRQAWSGRLAGVVPATAHRPGRLRRRSGPTFDMANPSIPRRAAFGLAATRTLPFDVEADDPSRAIAALRVLREQGRLRDAALSDEPTASNASAPDAPLGADRPAVTLVAGACTACGVCVRSCPHAALELVTAGTTTTLVHHQDVCRADLACVRLCPVGVLSVSEPLDLLQLAATPTVALAVVATGKCERCGAIHPAREGALCAICELRASNAFGSFRPPGPPGRGPRRADPQS